MRVNPAVVGQTDYMRQISQGSNMLDLTRFEQKD